MYILYYILVYITTSQQKPYGWGTRAHELYANLFCRNRIISIHQVMPRLQKRCFSLTN